jgi:antitoxin (DNA-binding transcriptional repressor) of toxin-antitoxin stability system
MTVLKDKNDLGLSELFDYVSAGDEVIITQNGNPIARVEPILRVQTVRVPGTAKGKISIPPEFFDPLPDDIVDAFYESKIAP